MADFLRTDDVAEADRFAQWRHWISSTFVPLECAQVSREPFRGEVASQNTTSDRSDVERQVGLPVLVTWSRTSCRPLEEGPREAATEEGEPALAGALFDNAEEETIR